MQYFADRSNFDHTVSENIYDCSPQTHLHLFKLISLKMISSTMSAAQVRAVEEQKRLANEDVNRGNAVNSERKVCIDLLFATLYLYIHICICICTY